MSLITQHKPNRYAPSTPVWPQQWFGAPGACTESPTNTMQVWSTIQHTIIHGLSDGRPPQTCDGSGREGGGSGSLMVAGVCWVEIAPEPQTRKSPCEPPDWQSGRLGGGAWGWDEQKGGRPGSLGKVNPATVSTAGRACRCQVVDRSPLSQRLPGYLVA